MPRSRKRAPSARGPEPLSEDKHDWLLSGLSLDSAEDCRWSDGTLAPFPDEEAARKAWEGNREALLAECGPGRRPWGWWRFEAPEDRLQLSGPAPLDEVPEVGSHVLKAGRIFRTFEQAEAAAFETDREYLTRLGLWLPGELAALSGLGNKIRGR